mgnify:CR=1 FL=1|tara:strand:- start:128 stop:292 length:165 start_codon:yes stop_codon:yes gene_type:complete
MGETEQWRLNAELKEKSNRTEQELEWYRTYSAFINANFPTVCAQASAYADGEED